MNNIRVLLVDDEPLAHKYLRRLLTQHPEFEVVGEAHHVEEAVRLCKELHPDLVFLDVQMPRVNGFAFFAELPAPPRVIFVTGYEKFALKAFEVSAVDYLMKPVSPRRLAGALAKFRQCFTPRVPAPGSQPIFQKIDGNTIPLYPSEIQAIHADGNYSTVQLSNGESLFLYRTLSEWEELLEKTVFVRLDRSLIVNSSQIAELVKVNRNQGRLHWKGAGEPLLLGRTAMLNVRRRLSRPGEELTSP